MWNVVVDALLDTLWLFPFLLLLYILIELMEHKTRMGHPSHLLTGRAAPVIGAATGLLPMCGFSVMAAKLYTHRHLTLGALFAVFIATSDEGLLVLLFSVPDSGQWLNQLFAALALLAGKLLLGIMVGYAIDLVLARKPLPLPEHHEHGHGHGENPSVTCGDSSPMRGAEEAECGDSPTRKGAEEAECGESPTRKGAEEAECGDSPTRRGAEEEHEDGSCACDELSVCEHKKESKLTLFLISPLLHALEVAGFVLLFNLLLGFLFFGIGGGSKAEGSEVVGSFMQGTGFWLQPLLCSAVGLIPNCASSVAIAEVYTLGGIGFGGLFGGLVANAGLGYLALFRGRESVKGAVLILLAMFALGVAAGYAASALSLLF